MAWSPDYATATELKAHLRITDTADDLYIADVITAASRAIDHSCGRQFGSEASAVARYYTYSNLYWIDGRAAVPIDDLHTTTDLAVAFDDDGDATWGQTVSTTTDVILWPYNASRDGKPWTHLLAHPSATYLFPSSPNGIRVTGRFGWAAVPSVVKTACLIQAARFFARRDAAFGVAGSPEVGSEIRLLDRIDPDVAVLLQGVRRWWGAVN